MNIVVFYMYSQEPNDEIAVLSVSSKIMEDPDNNILEIIENYKKETGELPKNIGKIPREYLSQNGIHFVRNAAIVEVDQSEVFPEVPHA